MIGINTTNATDIGATWHHETAAGLDSAQFIDNVTVVPEPATLGSVGTARLALMLLRRRMTI